MCLGNGRYLAFAFKTYYNCIATQVYIHIHLGKVFLSFGKNAFSYLAFPGWIVELVWRKQEFAFFVRSFRCALFTVWGETMGFRFRKSINLGGGFRVNLSKSGVGYSWGTKGARFTKTAKGTSRTTVGIPGTGISYVTESSNSKKNKQRKTPKNATYSNQVTAGPVHVTWMDFLLCLFLGMLGVHKFRENRVGMGLLYLFTGGLFGIGWLIDCIKYLVGAIQNTSLENYAISEVMPNVQQLNGPEIPEKPRKNRKTWLVVAGIVLSIVVLGAACGTNEETGENPAATVPETTVHVHEFAEATCKIPKTCNTCGETEGELAEHLWVEANCITAQTCSVCGETQGEIGTHIWENATCAVPKTCTACGITEGKLADHSWVEATCIAPKTCSVCEKTEGDPKEHSWKKATCEAPKTCKECGVEEGELGEHNWKKATCENPKTCKTCGETTGSLKDHKYKSGKCTACGAKEPTVWIPKSGKKYHSNSSCSRMKNPKKVTISKAKKMGYEPCSKC